MSEARPILVAGGGLGGLSAALALGRKGFPVRVLEQAAKFAPIGYGIQLGPNVFPMFARLGITDAVMREATIPKSILMLDALSGEEVTHIPTGPAFRNRFTHPYIIIHREDIHRVLIEACAALPNVTMEGGAAVAGFTEDAEGVEAALEDGRRVAGAALIGADGLRSAVRASCVTEGDPIPIGYVAHRTIVPMNELPAHISYREESVLWGGPGFHIVHYPLRHGTLFNLVAVFRTATFAERLDPAAYTAEVRKTYRDAHPVLKTLTDMMDLGRRWIIADRDPIRHWGRGRVTLVGDAAHPVLQSFAQGACMAIEDGVVLGEMVGQSGGDLAAAFARYTKARLLRTARLALESRAIWSFYHAEGIARDVRNDMCARWGDDDLFRCLAWLYDGVELPAEPAAQ
ncbi:MAG TPA: FAD-dependent monooxygenase [Xanthobacteraceae bacterium]|nr:FAD-dependent monooxygenase [Xanthobacteraceae bacterium]